MYEKSTHKTTRKFVAAADAPLCVLVDVAALFDELVELAVVAVVVEADTDIGFDEVVEIIEVVAVPGTHWSGIAKN